MIISYTSTHVTHRACRTVLLTKGVRFKRVFDSTATTEKAVEYVASPTSAFVPSNDLNTPFPGGLSPFQAALNKCRQRLTQWILSFLPTNDSITIYRGHSPILTSFAHQPCKHLSWTGFQFVTSSTLSVDSWIADTQTFESWYLPDGCRQW